MTWMEHLNYLVGLDMTLKLADTSSLFFGFQFFSHPSKKWISGHVSRQTGTPGCKCPCCPLPAALLRGVEGTNSVAADIKSSSLLETSLVPAAIDARWHSSLTSPFCHSLGSSLSWDMRWAFVESFAPFFLRPIISALRWAYFLTGLRHN